MQRQIVSRRELAFGLCALGAAPAWAATATDAVDVRSFGAVGDGATDDTAALKRAHASGRPLIYPRTKGYFRTTLPLDVKADVIGRGGELRIHGNGSNNMELLRVGKDAPPVTISGMVLDGEYEFGTAGEWSHGVALRSAHKVTIVGNQIRRPYGDCIYVGVDDETKRPCADIVIENNQLLAPRRCNVAVISADGVRIAGNRIVSPHGYVAAIDLEPNHNGVDRIREVLVQGNDFDTAGTFMMITKGDSDPTSGVTIKQNIGRAGIFLETHYLSGNRNSIVGNQFTSISPSKGSFISVYKTNDILVEDNRDKTACDGRYLSIWPKQLPGLTLQGNWFCARN